jgi:hypothetical protein
MKAAEIAAFLLFQPVTDIGNCNICKHQQTQDNNKKNSQCNK